MAKSRLLAKGDRIGLYMIVASLAVIVVVIGMLFIQQTRAQETRIRAEAISLARVLAGLPKEQLIAPRGMLEVVRQAWQNGNFAYAAVVGPTGAAVAEVTAPGIIVPRYVFPERPDAWISERELALSAKTSVFEIQAPILEQGAVVSYLRLGFYKPTFTPAIDQLPFFATLAFVVFLLTPIFYFLIRREVRPLRRANERLGELVTAGQLGEIQLNASGELGEFMHNFNEFIKFAKGRVEALEKEQTNLVTRTQLLSYKKARIETVLDSIPEAVIIIDQTGTISFANQRVETLLGASARDVMEKDPNEWCSSAEVLEALGRYSSNLSSKQYLAQTVRIQPKKTAELSISIKAYPLFSPNDVTNIQGTLIVIRDISREILAQRGQSEFVTHVAHELKTPLNTIGLASERLLYDTDMSESARIESVNIVQDEVDRMAGLIGNLLNITKIEMGELPIERSLVKLREFLQDVFDNVSRSDRDKNLNFHIELPNDFSVIFLDKDLLRIAINNLLTNAIKYSDPGGNITLVAEETEDSIRIAVRDDGIGISGDDQERIFTKFFRSDDNAVRRRSGHGLGLSLCQEIVQMHNGALTVESTPGEGSEFTIELRKEASMLRQVV
jgi:PAS domain S-box-containing protein